MSNLIKIKRKQILYLEDGKKRLCNKCNEIKEIAEFSKSRSNSNCLSCAKEYKKKYYSTQKGKEVKYKNFTNSIFKKKYGINIEIYQEMLLKQNGLCAICKKPELSIHHFSGKPMNLSVDHCHKTGKVRGLLCASCNKGLGCFKDDIDSLKSCVSYLYSFIV